MPLAVSGLTRYYYNESTKVHDARHAVQPESYLHGYYAKGLHIYTCKVDCSRAQNRMQAEQALRWAEKSLTV